MDARDEAEVDEAPGEECSANIVVPWAMQELSVFRTYYKRELDGLDDDAILSCAVIRQSNSSTFKLASKF